MKDKKKQTATNFYMDGRREWMERYGDYIKQKRIWQILAIVSLVVTVVTVLAALSLASKSRFVPYVVEVDKLGEVVNTSFPNEEFTAKSVHIKSELSEWIQNSRSVTSDGDAQRLYVENVYSFINRSDAAFETLTDFSKDNWTRAAKETVSVQVIGTPLKITKSTWQIEWIEFVRNRKGKLIREERWKGNFQIYFGTPKKQSDLMKNPLGIYVKEINWTLQRTI